MGISTHILDTSKGRPARGVTVALELLDGSIWRRIGEGVTNDDGRVKPLLEPLTKEGTYRIHFEVGAYFKEQQIESFFPRVSIEFAVRSIKEHYHVPLLLNPYGYSTYRGS
jgi:5-hydroxyisourate hydrolase